LYFPNENSYPLFTNGRRIECMQGSNGTDNPISSLMNSQVPQSGFWSLDFEVRRNLDILEWLPEPVDGNERVYIAEES